jgi:hypothetical protein
MKFISKETVNAALGVLAVVLVITLIISLAMSDHFIRIHNTLNHKLQAAYAGASDYSMSLEYGTQQISVVWQV